MTFLIANSIYVFVRIATLTLATLVFLYGLSQRESVFDYNTGNFNIPLVRFSALGLIVIFEAYLSYMYITKQIKRTRENTTSVQVVTKSKQKSKKKEGETILCNFLITTE